MADKMMAVATPHGDSDIANYISIIDDSILDDIDIDAATTITPATATATAVNNTAENEKEITKQNQPPRGGYITATDIASFYHNGGCEVFLRLSHDARGHDGSAVKKDGNEDSTKKKDSVSSGGSGHHHSPSQM
ncbi:hypothetical protein HDU76_005494, partial [Blyttiomyces sp. JEL0837]